MNSIWATKVASLIAFVLGMASGCSRRAPPDKAKIQADITASAALGAPRSARLA